MKRDRHDPRRHTAGAVLLVAVASLFLTAAPAFAQQPPEVDPELLEGLEDLLEQEQDREQEEAPRTGGADRRRDPDARLGQDPLTEIAAQMAAVGTMIEQGRIDATTLGTQDAVLEALDRLLEQLGSPPSDSAESEPPDSPAADDASQTEAGEMEIGETAGDAEADEGDPGEGSESQDGEEGAGEAGEGGEATGEGPGQAGGRPGSTDVRAAADVPRQEAIWGHLPAQVRGELRSVRPDQYHPRYRELIEAYYRRLAELDAD